MASLEDFTDEASGFLEEYQTKIDGDKGLLEEFLRKYPLRINPEAIDELTPETLYSPGIDNRDDLFYWVEFKLNGLGRLSVGNDSWWKSACESIDILKGLLKTALDDERSLAEKIDLNWGEIRYWKGDKTVAKKIISLYYPDEVIPIFVTRDREHF